MDPRQAKTALGGVPGGLKIALGRVPGGLLEATGGQYQTRVPALRFLEASWGRLGSPLGVVLGPLGAVLAILEAS